MRVFGIKSDGEFHEFVKTPFHIEHEEAILEEWLESNPDGIVEDGRVLIIGRQVNTDLGGFIDLLGIDREGDVVVIELKRDRTPRHTVAQALEYASFAEQLDTEELEGILRSYLNNASLSLAEYHREYFELDTDDAVAFNKDQRLVIVGQRVTQEIRQTSTFLRSKGIRVTCVEFTFFQADSGTCLLSQEIVVGKESMKPKHISSGSLPVVDEASFIDSVDEYGKKVFTRILQFAKKRNMPIHWGTKGFSLNTNVDGTHVTICFGYPPDSVFKQTIRTTLHDSSGIVKTATPDAQIQALQQQVEQLGIFVPAGKEMKCEITESLTEEEISSLLKWLDSVAKTIEKYGLKQNDDET